MKKRFEASDKPIEIKHAVPIRDGMFMQKSKFLIAFWVGMDYTGDNKQQRRQKYDFLQGFYSRLQ